MSLFSNTQLPDWMTPEITPGRARAAESNGRMFAESFNASSARAQQSAQFAQKMMLEVQESEVRQSAQQAQTAAQLLANQQKLEFTQDAPSLQMSIAEMRKLKTVDDVWNMPSPEFKTMEALRLWENEQIQVSKMIGSTALGRSIATENDAFNKALGELPIGKNEVLRLRGDGQTPSEESWTKLNEMLAAQEAKKLEKVAPTLTPGKVGERDVVISPGGAIHYTDNFSPVDKAELGSLNKTLLDIDREARKLASEPNPERARALNAQRLDAEAKKEDLVSKYSNPAAGAKQTMEWRPSKFPDDGSPHTQNMPSKITSEKPSGESQLKLLKSGEVMRKTGDGRNAIFDSKTKEFIRYGD